MRIEMIERVLESPQEFYRRSLFGPYVALGFAFPFLLVTPPGSFFNYLSNILIFALVIGIFGLSPYLAVSIPLYYWMRRQSIAVARRTLLIWPPLLVAAVIVFLSLFAGWEGVLRRKFWNESGVFFSIILLCGYAWILSVRCLGYWLEKRGKFLNSQKEQAVQIQPMDAN